jgi:hypothetical protein
MFYPWRRKGWWAALIVCGGLVEGKAASVRLAWNANTESDLAGYRIYYGVSSREYTNRVEVGNVTTTTVSNLPSGATYYFAATAYNTAGLESDFSNEASAQIVQPQGNKPPTLDPISNMVVSANSGPISVKLTGISAGGTNEAQNITITASSSNPDVVPTPTVTYRTPDSTGLLTFTPVATAEGVAEITVIVSDGTSKTGTLFVTFDVTVRQPLPPLALSRSGSDVVISWPVGQYVLQSCTNLPPVSGWSNVSITPTLNGDYYQVIEPPTERRKFYRLAYAADAQADTLLRLVWR